MKRATGLLLDLVLALSLMVPACGSGWRDYPNAGATVRDAMELLPQA